VFLVHLEGLLLMLIWMQLNGVHNDVSERLMGFERAAARQRV